MNLLDLAVLGIIALSALFAFARGFVREALSILAWGGAALITFYGLATITALVAPYVTTPFLAQLIAGAGLFLISLIALSIATGFVSRAVSASSLSAIDRTLGFIFGLARGIVLVSLAYLLVELVQPNDRPAWIREARSAPLLAQGADMLRTIVPEPIRFRSAAAVDNAGDAIGRANEAQRAMRALSTPSGTGAAATPAPNGGALPATAQGNAPASTPQATPSGTPVPAAKPEPPPGAYKPGDRQGMDRLIQNTR